MAMFTINYHCRIFEKVIYFTGSSAILNLLNNDDGHIIKLNQLVRV